MWQNITPIYQGLYKKVIQNTRYKMKTISILSSLQIAFISECDKASKDLVGFLFLPSRMWQHYEHPSRVSQSVYHFSPLLNTQSRKTWLPFWFCYENTFILYLCFSPFLLEDSSLEAALYQFYFIFLWSVRQFILHGCNFSGIEVMLLVLFDSGFSF